ncbi:MAG: hypothetical protein WBX14_07965, partial [Candidatus Udaeobacter sp.]
PADGQARSCRVKNSLNGERVLGGINPPVAIHPNVNILVDVIRLCSSNVDLLPSVFARYSTAALPKQTPNFAPQVN